MATNFPTSLDNFPNPVAGDATLNPGNPLGHPEQHTNMNDAIEALEAKVGVNGSAVTSSLDYKVAQGVTVASAHAAATTGIHGVGAGAVMGTTLTQTVTNKTMSGANNTFSNIPQSAVAGMPVGAVVGISDSQTLTNKTMSGASNTFSNIPQSAVTGLSAIITSLATAPTMTVFTSSGSHADPGANVRAVKVRLVGGGGAGGGAVVTGASESSGGGGGQGGHYAEGIIPYTSIAWPVTVTVGDGGTAVTGAAGNAGQTSSYGSYVSAGGGAGGAAGVTGATNGLIALGGNAAVTATGTLTVVGGFGGNAHRANTGTTIPGEGGFSLLSGRVYTSTNGATGAGIAGQLYGGGGSGGKNASSQVSTQLGGVGGKGVVIVELIR